MNRWTGWLSRGGLVVALGVVIPACNPYGAYCEEKVDCEGGNDMDVDACVAESEQAEEHASLWDCDEWFDLLFECVEAEAECDNDHYGVDGDNCESEAEDYSSCM